MLITIVPVLTAILGALLYALSKETKSSELGRIAYFVGLFWVMAVVAGHVIKLG